VLARVIFEQKRSLSKGCAAKSDQQRWFDRAKEIKEQKALLRDKSKPKIRPSLRLSPLLRRTSAPPFDTMTGFDRPIAMIFITRQLLRCVLLSSDGANRRKVMLLIA